MDRWQQISSLFHAALARPAAAREEYLRAECGDDEDLRRQVESLIAATEDTRTSASRQGRPDTVTAHQPLVAGHRLARYRVISQLGAGGMGEVYRARDEQLHRDIALKVLPPSDLDDPAARARLVREARAAAALNHPHICTVHEVGEETGQAYIAMELVEGLTLSAIIGDGPLSTEQVVRLGSQLADALAHAHDRGVVHRDLKSNNVIVTPDGRVKVLDFGLAKRSTAADLALTQLQMSLTQPGTVAGTLPYMAPEQLRGEPVTAASDIWALGVMLYEMTTGKRPFRGQTPYEVSAAILNDPPAPLPSAAPPRLAAIVQGCLQKDVSLRYHSAALVRDALGTPSAAPALAAAAPATTIPVARESIRRAWRPSRRTALAMTLTVAAGLVAVAGWRMWPSLFPVDVRTLAVLPLVNTAKDMDLEYLCEGVADSLIRRLAALPGLRVSQLRTVLSFKERLDQPAAIGRDLDVKTVLAGTFSRDGNQLHITARLIDVMTGRELWTNSYDRDARQLLNVQDDIASSIVNEGLRIRLTNEERRRMELHPTTNGDAYDLYLQSDYVQRGSTEEDYLYAKELLERAIAYDRNFAQAYSAISGLYAMLVTDGYARPSDAWPQVSRYNRLAKDLDPESGGADAIDHAVAFFFDWDWEGAERARKRVLQVPLATTAPDGLRALAIELWALGKPEEALDLSRRMRELDPRAAYLTVGEADLLLRMGRFDEAIALYEATAKFDPKSPNLYFGLSEALYRRGRFDEALATRHKAHMLAGDDRLEPVFARARGEQGYKDVERAWLGLQLAALKEREVNRYVSPLDFARVYAQLGDREQTFRYLDASFKDRSPGLVFLKVDRAWDNVRNDPRFAEAVKRVGLP